MRMATGACSWSNILDENTNVTVPTLKFLALRAASLKIFQKNQGRHAVRNAQRFMRDYVRYLPIPFKLRQVLADGLTQSFREVHRWWDKHAELFQDNRKARRSEHLSLYFHCIKWNNTDMCISDYETALRLVKEMEDWPQLRFQIACAYAMEDILYNTDEIRLRVFHKRLNDHPLYEFWLLKLYKAEPKQVSLWLEEGLAPSQPVSLAFQWALKFGYQELARYIWDKVTPPQQEYIGLLEWRTVCTESRNRATFKFLCNQLCKVNSVSVLRITYHIFYHSLHKVITEPKCLTAIRELNIARVKFFLHHGCETLRQGLLQAHDFRCIQLALQYKDLRVFSMLQSYLSEEQLSLVRHHFESTDSLRPKDLAPIRHALAQRQWSLS